MVETLNDLNLGPLSFILVKEYRIGGLSWEHVMSCISYIFDNRLKYFEIKIKVIKKTEKNTVQMTRKKAL